MGNLLSRSFQPDGICSSVRELASIIWQKLWLRRRQLSGLACILLLLLSGAYRRQPASADITYVAPSPIKHRRGTDWASASSLWQRGEGQKLRAGYTYLRRNSHQLVKDALYPHIPAIPKTIQDLDREPSREEEGSEHHPEAGAGDAADGAQSRGGSAGGLTGLVSKGNMELLTTLTEENKQQLQLQWYKYLGTVAEHPSGPVAASGATAMISPVFNSSLFEATSLDCNATAVASSVGVTIYNITDAAGSVMNTYLVGDGVYTFTEWLLAVTGHLADYRSTPLPPTSPSNLSHSALPLYLYQVNLLATEQLYTFLDSPYFPSLPLLNLELTAPGRDLLAIRWLPSKPPASCWDRKCCPGHYNLAVQLGMCPKAKQQVCDPANKLRPRVKVLQGGMACTCQLQGECFLECNSKLCKF